MPISLSLCAASGFLLSLCWFGVHPQFFSISNLYVSAGGCLLVCVCVCVCVHILHIYAWRRMSSRLVSFHSPPFLFFFSVFICSAVLMERECVCECVCVHVGIYARHAHPLCVYMCRYLPCRLPLLPSLPSFLPTEAVCGLRMRESVIHWFVFVCVVVSVCSKKTIIRWQ